MHPPRLPEEAAPPRPPFPPRAEAPALSSSRAFMCDEGSPANLIPLFCKPNMTETSVYVLTVHPAANGTPPDVVALLNSRIEASAVCNSDDEDESKWRERLCAVRRRRILILHIKSLSSID
ncbi:MAG: hypothetical protein SGPRY_003292 [Prymnesium sp.]